MKRAHGGGDGRSGKRRKTYTLRKERETWSPEEHLKFVDALSVYGKDWKKIEVAVGTKTVSQIRSHAQKYGDKLAAQGKTLGEEERKGSAMHLKLPWINTPDALASKPHLLDPANFTDWLKTNKLYRKPPLDLSADALPPVETVERLLQAEQEDCLKQALQFMAHAATSIPTPTNVVNWKKLHHYLISLTRDRSLPHAESPSDVKWTDLTPTERQIIKAIMENIVGNLNTEEVRGKLTGVLESFGFVHAAAPSLKLPQTQESSEKEGEEGAPEKE